MAKLYLVGTPIGNLGDIPPRAAKTLEEVDFIAAEDTRVSLKLLSHLGIKKPMISYHEHNRISRGEEIVRRIRAGEDCAIITDAGMPCISDPGEDLVRLCGQEGIETVVVPGPSAVVCALALSGLATGRFSFEGFLSVQKGSRKQHLEEIRTDPRTLVFYEAPHKLRYTLRDLLEALGDRRISLARELTKLHEEVVRTTLSDAVVRYETETPRGEFVLVVEGHTPDPQEEVPFGEALEMVRARHGEGQALSRAAKEVAALTGHRRSELYAAAVKAPEG